jgi:hypothetical protein
MVAVTDKLTLLLLAVTDSNMLLAVTEKLTPAVGSDRQ